MEGTYYPLFLPFDLLVIVDKFMMSSLTCQISIIPSALLKNNRKEAAKGTRGVWKMNKLYIG